MLKSLNNYVTLDKITFIQLENSDQTVLTLIDTEDLEKVVSFRWYLTDCGKYAGYARTTINTAEKNYYLYLHQFILNTHLSMENLEIDHKNRQTLDNRKSNLQISTRSQNLFNTGLFSHNTSGYKGVGYYKQTNKWRAHIKVNQKSIHLGYFSTFEEAIRARRKAEVNLLEEN